MTLVPLSEDIMITLLANAISQFLKKDEAFQGLLSDWRRGKFPLNVEGAQGFFLAPVLAHLARETPGTLFLVTSTDAEAETWAADLNALGLEPEILPWWGTLLYQGISAQASIFGERSRLLSRLSRRQPRLVLVSLRSLLFPVPSVTSWKAKLTTFRKGNTIHVQKTAERLVQLGYMRVPRVTVPGEFALRGEVLDLFLPGEEQAVRLVFGFDTIEDIKHFDPVTQSSRGGLDELLVYPAREVVWDEQALTQVDAAADRLGWGEEWLPLREALRETGDFRGLELFYPFAEENPTPLWSYADETAIFLFPEWEKLHAGWETLRKETKQMYQQARSQGLLVPDPEKVFFRWEQFLKEVPRRAQFPTLHTEATTEPRHLLSCEPPRAYFGNIPFFKDEVTNLKTAGYQVFVVAGSSSQAQRLEFLLKDSGAQVFPAQISSGFVLSRGKIAVIHENEIFGRKRKGPASLKTAQTQALDSFVDLSPGDFVVHINYGIGRFLGIERVRVAGNERDYIKIEYSSDETIFLPIEQINLIQRYIGSEGKEPRLDVLGGKSWEAKKSRAKKSVEELADRLITLYAKRQNAQGHSFGPDNDWQASFEAAFPFDETEDQLRAIAEIKADMESPRPMDRLLCGDVGYGKTEVAMRACFKAVISGKQVAFLAPTTILTEQHFENFQDRFGRFPVRIGMLSRFVPKAEQKQTLAKLAKGELDVVIGTHRLLQKDVAFKNLGLLVIDEEQRFGVKDKERLKELKTSIDCLAMSATPIPRTLHMSLLKIRDMSVLRTAPHNRQPIETFLQEFSDDVVAKAIRREVERGGQVFFLHNRIETLEATELYLRRLLPELLIRSAHGQMDPKDLEEVMHDFIHGNFHVLVSTTIVENGIDIPNVNTIIIDRADMYGISQLYQLRGRVGRSGKVAFAYLLYPDGRALTELAMKRLQVISDFTELGAGFKIAMKDLEVRGAGNLLGAEQSGDILSVGFEMYLRLLNEAVAAKTDQKPEEVEEIYMELDYSGFIPDNYIQDPTDKMDVYKKIASVVTEEDLERVNQEVYDRFGPLPDEVHSLMSLAEIQIICRKLKVKSVRERNGLCAVEFGRMVDFPFDKAMRLLKESGGQVKSLPDKPNVLVFETKKIGLAEKSIFLRERLSRLL